MDISDGIDAGYTPMQAAALTTLPPGYTARLFQIESGGNPTARSGSYRGLGQFGPNEEKAYGITDWTDPAQQTRGLQREAAGTGPALAKALGRQPTAGELYLAHQQGIAGGPALLTAHPDMPAWQAIRPYYGSDAAAQKRITDNIPRGSGLDPNSVTAGDFSKYWVSRFESSGAPPTQVASAQPATDNSAAAKAPPPASTGPGLNTLLGGTPTDFSKLAQLIAPQPLTPVTTPNILPGPTVGQQLLRASFDPAMALRQKIIAAITGQQQQGQTA